MALSFACPGCKVELQLPDDLAGQTGQCPRCQRMMLIPSSSQPRPVLLEETPPPSAREKVPPASAQPRPATGKPTSSRPAPASPPKPRWTGPVWPWLVGGLGLLICAGFLLASFTVLLTYRPGSPNTKTIKDAQKPHGQFQGVRFGRLDGNRVTLVDGLFQVRTELNHNDVFDFGDNLRRCKRFDVSLQQGKIYILEQDSQFFQPLLRLEDFNKN